MRWIIYSAAIFLFSFLGGWYANSLYHSQKQIVEPVTRIKPRPLDKYTIENLSNTKIPKGTFEIKEVLSEEEGFTSNLFDFAFDPTLVGNDEKTITGQINIPDGQGNLPLILMLRGYVDQEIYQTGVGTRRGAEYFANNGFITVAPDFLGYAGSDKEAENIMEARFQSYTTTLALLESLEQVDKWDGENIFIWGHSNGGQVALVTLEVTKREIPTTLWAPVTKPFPYSILYYTDESEDRGKLLRKEIAKFEETYDPDLYSLDLYFDKIKAPLQIHQGAADDAVPLDWSNEFVAKLKKLEKEVNYYTYQGADHNMRPSWDSVVARDLAFFQKNLE